MAGMYSTCRMQAWPLRLMLLRPLTDEPDSLRLGLTGIIPTGLFNFRILAGC
jgi:hypothetical protein